jgi:hypothetical protein
MSGSHDARDGVRSGGRPPGRADGASVLQGRDGCSCSDALMKMKNVEGIRREVVGGSSAELGCGEA